jgi:tetratricopeptide (TPR) repeat protein
MGASYSFLAIRTVLPWALTLAFFHVLSSPFGVGSVDGWALLLTLLCYLPAVPVVIWLQELSHYLAAWLMGFDIVYVALGDRTKILDGRILGHSIYLRAYPFLGITCTATRNRTLLRLRLSLLYLARLITCAGVAALAIYLFQDRRPPVWSEALLVCSIFGLLGSLSAEELRRPFGNIPSSGLALRQLYSLGEEGLTAYSVRSYLYEADHLLDEGRSAEAIALLDEGLAKYKHPGLRLGLGNAYLDQGEDLRAKQLFQEMLAAGFPDRISLLNNIAWADLSLGREHLEEAARYSEEACRYAPENQSVQNTRGAVLIRLGRVEEGMALLQKLQRDKLRRREPAYDACWRAIGSALLGRPEEARQLLEQARQLNPRCPHLRMATEEVAAAEEALASARAPSPFRRDHRAK